jgi:DNA-binding MarR family transcriptional regulator
MTGDWTEEVLERWAGLRPELDLEPYLVTARISRIALHIARSQEEVFARFGLNRGEVGVLSALRTAGADDRLTPTRLFKGLMLSSAGMTKRLDALEGRGLLRRLPDPDDRRGVRIELTAEGRRLVERAFAANTRAERKLLEGLGSRDRRSLGGLLRKLLAIVEAGDHSNG